MKEWLSRKDIEERREMYLGCIDQYTEYIESYSQYEQAIKSNKKYSKLASFCSSLLDDLDKTESELKVKGLEGKVEYSKGYFRTIINGVYKYKKSSVVYKN